jgi:hypothetical protein
MAPFEALGVWSLGILGTLLVVLVILMLLGQVPSGF